jgi:hypothetical protein
MRWSKPITIRGHGFYLADAGKTASGADCRGFSANLLTGVAVAFICIPATSVPFAQWFSPSGQKRHLYMRRVYADDSTLRSRLGSEENNPPTGIVECVQHVGLPPFLQIFRNLPVLTGDPSCGDKTCRLGRPRRSDDEHYLAWAFMAWCFLAGGSRRKRGRPHLRGSPLQIRRLSAGCRADRRLAGVQPFRNDVSLRPSFGRSVLLKCLGFDGDAIRSAMCLWPRSHRGVREN